MLSSNSCIFILYLKWNAFALPVAKQMSILYTSFRLWECKLSCKVQKDFMIKNTAKTSLQNISLRILEVLISQNQPIFS